MLCGWKSPQYAHLLAPNAATLDITNPWRSFSKMQSVPSTRAILRHGGSTQLMQFLRYTHIHPKGRCEVAIEIDASPKSTDHVGALGFRVQGLGFRVQGSGFRV